MRHSTKPEECEGPIVAADPVNNRRSRLETWATHLKDIRTLLLSAFKKLLSTGAGSQRRMKVIESLSLGGKQRLYLVRCDERQYLVGAGTESVATIVAIESQSQTGNPSPAPARRPLAPPQATSAYGKRPWLVNSSTPIPSTRAGLASGDATGQGVWQ